MAAKKKMATRARTAAKKLAGPAKAGARKVMSKKRVQPIPKGYHVVTPHLVIRGASGAIEFYKNAFGEVHTLSPWRLVDYWAWTREPHPDDFVIR